jgi:DNA-binding PadR family transcriptional regulator
MVKFGGRTVMARRGPKLRKDTKFGKWKIMSILESKPDATVSDIQERIGKKSSLIYNTLYRLERDGYAVKSTKEREGVLTKSIVYVYNLTPDGVLYLHALESGITEL